MKKYVVTQIAVMVIEADNPDEAEFQLAEYLESANGGGGPWEGLHIETSAELVGD